MDGVEEEIRSEWECLIRANIIKGQGLQIKNIVKYIMPMGN